MCSDEDDSAHEHGPVLRRLVSLGYSNLHLIAIFAFLATARLIAPLRYPKVRTAFALAHLPALVVLAAYPLAPPHWVAGLPFANGPPAHTSASSQRWTILKLSASTPK